MKLSGEAKFFIGVIGVTFIILIGAIFFFSQPPKEVSHKTLVPSNAWTKGPQNPRVTLVEFSDFECPACGTAFPVVKSVVEKYQNDVKFVYRHFPLDQHTNARLAAEAGEAAGAQGKFWEMHDTLFKNQTNLSRESINGMGLELKLDMEKFTKELDQGTYKDKVQADIDDGAQLGVDATPTFFLNGKKLKLFSFGDLDGEIQKALGN
ncbi:DsbA family protein [Candidatus Gottesmanbacteria bacterium]|nr:DsbA family protein [Candidatus Gottesmanbacteria bacterium]